MDYRRLNAVRIAESYSLLILDDFMYIICNVPVLSILEEMVGYFHMPFME